MFLTNDLLKMHEIPSRTVRLLWISNDQVNASIIDIYSEKSVPELVKLSELVSAFNERKITILDKDPFISVLNEDALSVARKKVRNHAWSIISNLVNETPKIFDSHYRSALINKAVASKLATRPTIWRYLRQFWQRGQTPNALLPDYDKSGGKGKVREPGDSKRGKPKEFGDRLGLNIDSNIRSLILTTIERYYVPDEKFSMAATWNKMLEDFFHEKAYSAELGQVITVLKPEWKDTGSPNYQQFCYWLKNSYPYWYDLVRQRKRERVYDLNFRGLVGTSTTEVWGPGSRYQIDATIADVYLVSRLNRNKIIGRPVLYVVIDVFSRMIVGIYVGLEGPSWVGAMMALANTVSDKVGFCKKFGRKINPQQWPCCSLPASILGDKGEMGSGMVEMLANKFNVIVENASAYRADWKGIVEQRFKLIPAKFKSYVPGYIRSDYRKRGGRDYRLDATLNLDEFTKIIIEIVLYYNNSHEVKGYDRIAPMIDSDVFPVPLELWNWGVINRSGALRRYPEEYVRYSLLPVETAAVTPYGIRFKNVYYSCEQMMRERWFDKARQTKRSKVTFSYDPRNVSEIYVHTSEPGTPFLNCSITDRSRAYKGASLWEVESAIVTQKNQSANHREVELAAHSHMTNNIESIVNTALKDQHIDPDLSNSKRVAEIRKNRAEEKEGRRNDEAFTFGNEHHHGGLDVKSKIEMHRLDDAYDVPDITEIVRLEQGGGHE